MRRYKLRVCFFFPPIISCLLSQQVKCREKRHKEESIKSIVSVAALKLEDLLMSGSSFPNCPARFTVKTLKFKL